jgi:hypothetical protein
MNTFRKPALLAGALLLASASTTSLAHGVKRFEVDFDKCATSLVFPGYLVTFAGPVSGDVSGTVQARVVTLTRGIELNQTYIQADYVVEGSLPFTARVGGRRDDSTGLATLRGFVSEGPAWLTGAGVHDEFAMHTRADGTPCAKGTLYITPRWKQTESDNDD